MPAVFDNHSTGNNNASSAGPLQWNHTIGGSGNNRLLVVGIELESNSGTPVVSSVTYNGVNLTKINSDVNSGGTHRCQVEMWALWGSSVPASGTYQISVAFSATVNLSQAAGAMSFLNIKAQTAEANGTINASATTPLSKSITTLTSNALLVTVYGSQNVPAASSTTSDTQAFNSVPASAEQSECDGFYRTVASPASSNVSLSLTNPESEVMIVASFAVSNAGINQFDI